MATKIKVFYHVAELPGWNNMMTDQLTTLYESGLLEAADQVHICVNGDMKNFDPAKSVTKQFKNIQWHQVNKDAKLNEYPTLDFLKKHCDDSNEEFYICYMHMKGLSRPTDSNTRDWRKYLEFWGIERWKTNVSALDEDVDAVGTNWFDKHEVVLDPRGNKVTVFPHFSANFWWARASYIRSLKPLVHPDNIVIGEFGELQQQPYSEANMRYDNEAWIGSGKPRIHCIHESPGKTAYPGWHFDNPYPREKYDEQAVNEIIDGTSFSPATFLDLHQPRILIDRRKALGDVLMITPVLAELRKRWGKMSWIQVVTEETIVLKNNPDVNCVVKPSQMIKEDPWDVYINLNDAYETNPLCNYIDCYFARAFGRPEFIPADVDKSIRVHPTTEEIERVAGIIKEKIQSDYIVVHMRRWAWENKNIDVNIWGTFFTLLNEKYPNLKIVSVGAQYDYKATDIMNGVDLSNELSIGEMNILISMSKVFIGGDSGPYWVAASTPAPIVALLSHMNPDQILPWRDGVYGKNVTVVQSDVPCVGCYKRQATVPVRNLVCENDEQWLCSKKFSPQSMLEAVEKYL
jgi:ADP-heptose:LPS heptosyltransferase